MTNAMHINEMKKKIFLTIQFVVLLLFVTAQEKEKYSVYPTDSNIIFDFCFFGNGEKLAVADNTSIKIFFTSSQQQLDEIKTDLSDRILAVDVSKDDKIIAFGGRDGKVIIGDLSNKTTLQSISLTGKVITALSISPDGKLLAIGSSDGNVEIYDIKNKNTKFELTGHKKDIASLKFSPDGKMLATAGGDKKINLFLVENGTLITTLSDHKSWVRSISFINNEKIVSSGDDSKIIQWDFADLQNTVIKKTKLPSFGIITSVDFFHEITSFAASGINGKILISTQAADYFANLKMPVTKVLFIPYEKLYFKLVVASKGAGIIQINAEKMKFKNSTRKSKL
jgi:WD40 repeat protein